MAGILGSSVSTKAQIQKVFSTYNIENRDNIIDLYMKYGMQYDVQYTVAIAMCLLYTDFFTNEIINNNLVGIGKQFQFNKLEVFRSPDECIIAQYELLRTGADRSFILENPNSLTYQNLIDNKSSEGEPKILVGNITDIYDVYVSWKLNETGYTSTDFHTLIRDMETAKLDASSHDTPYGNYYYIRIATGLTRTPLLKIKRQVEREGFDNVHINVGKGFYTLEVGKEPTLSAIAITLRNLKKFGYSGYVGNRKMNKSSLRNGG